MSASPSPVETLLSTLTSVAANAAVATDPAARARLAALEGRSVRALSTQPPISITLRVRDGALEVMEDPDEAPNVVVRGSGADLLTLLFDPNARAAVEIEGDDTTLMELRAVFAALRPDPTGPIAGVLGTQAADTLVGAAELAFATLRSVAQSVSTAAEAEAHKHYASATDTDALLDRMQSVALRLDRLEARVALAEAQKPGRTIEEPPE